MILKRNHVTLSLFNKSSIGLQCLKNFLKKYESATKLASVNLNIGKSNLSDIKMDVITSKTEVLLIFTSISCLSILYTS